MHSLQTFTYASTPYESMRHVHLDFHTPGFVTVGDRFDAAQFGDTLEAAHVNSIAVFAHGHHGYSYFDTATGVKHPGLMIDLFGEMAAECARRGIQLLAYFSMNVNEVQAAAHPEWHAQNRDGSPVNSQILQDGTELFWTWLCPNRGGLVEEFFFPHVREALAKYPLDGVFVDMAGYLPGSCFCERCVALMASDGIDAANPREHARFNSARIQGIAGRLRALMDEHRPGLRLQMGGFLAFGEAHKAAGVTSEFYLESLAYQTGWEYFPNAARHCRNFGMPAIGMTGRFLKNWGDFGSIVSPHQLKTQMGMHLMAGLPSAVGDHMHCDGRLNEAVYETIGAAFEFVKTRQPHCVGMEPAREAAVLVPTGVGGGAATAARQEAAVHQAYAGACKLLAELHLQYDLVPHDTDLDSFALLVVTNGTFDIDFVARARAFVADGGVLLVDGYGMCAGDEAAGAAWQELIGVVHAGASDQDGMYYAVGAADAAIPDMPHYVHGGAMAAEFTDGAEVIAEAWYPPNVRSRARHYGHFHGPPMVTAGAAVVARSLGKGTVIVLLQVCAAYLNTGYHVHRALVASLLDRFLPAAQRVLTTNAPSIVDVSLGAKDGKTVLQLLPLVAERRYRYSFESLTDVVEMRDIWVELPGGTGVQAHDPVSGTPVPCEVRGSRVRIHVPPFREHTVLLVADSGQPVTA